MRAGAGGRLPYQMFEMGRPGPVIGVTASALAVSASAVKRSVTTCAPGPRCASTQCANLRVSGVMLRVSEPNWYGPGNRVSGGASTATFPTKTTASAAAPTAAAVRLSHGLRLSSAYKVTRAAGRRATPTDVKAQERCAD